jgi:hypothetical protein
LIGHQDILDASIDKYRSLTDFLATNAHCTHRHLPKCNLRALVAFGMRAQTHATAPQSLNHALQVAFKGIQVQQQGWGFDVRDGVTQGSGRPWAHSPNLPNAKRSINFGPSHITLCTDFDEPQRRVDNIKV